ncbi:MAG TPA: hypothetical protein VKA37_00045 [Halobacteriales archaeon]|nr:hypothetical protein [Halobacteriales archaeon]
MSLLRTVKRLFGSDDDQVVQLFNCNGCSNIFTRTWEAGERPAEITCPNCGSADVEVAVESP